MSTTTAREDGPASSNAVPVRKDRGASLSFLSTNVPRQIGPYRFVRHLGSGSFAQVYGAVHDGTGEEVAVKAIAARKLNAKLRENLECEIKILKDFKHENIVGLYGIDKTSSMEYIFLVMEYCDGGDLHQFLQANGALGEDVARVFMNDLARGLDFMWSKQFIHRDLKPQNLLLKNGVTGPRRFLPTLKIADFGFARHLEEATMAETTCGSPLYMAPEILRLQKYGANADLWSVGAIMFEMLTKRPPFTGTGRRSLIANIETKTIRYPDGIVIGQPAKDLLEGLLKVKPTERMSFQAFLSAPFLKTVVPTDTLRASASKVSPLQKGLAVQIPGTERAAGAARAGASGGGSRGRREPPTASQQHMQFVSGKQYQEPADGRRGAGVAGLHESEEFVVVLGRSSSTNGSSSKGNESSANSAHSGHGGGTASASSGAFVSGQFWESLWHRGLAVTHLADSRMARLHNQVSVNGSWGRPAGLGNGTETVASALACSLALYARALRLVTSALDCVGTSDAAKEAMKTSLKDIVEKSDACRAQAHFAMKAADSRGMLKTIRVQREENAMYHSAVAMGRRARALEQLSETVQVDPATAHDGHPGDPPLRQAQNLYYHAIYLLEDMLQAEPNRGQTGGGGTHDLTYADLHTIERLHEALSKRTNDLNQRLYKQGTPTTDNNHQQKQHKLAVKKE